MRPLSPRARLGFLIALLGIAVGAVYAEVGGFEFVSYDDPDYVLENPWVRAGLSSESVRWALTSAEHASNWHPLTWLSHMLDVELFGLTPAGPHWHNLVLHALNSVLCLLALRSLTGRLAPSAAVAFLFALHPLRVESVAWISERKDLLAGLFFFLLLLAHARFARAPGLGTRLALPVLFALGLCAKPMLISAPLVLLLLDAWPLGRLRTPREAGRRVLEKLPLLLLALASALLTLRSQGAGGSLSSLEVIPLAQRLANAPVAVWRYLGHLVWPRGLACFYPHPALLEPGRPAWTLTALLALAGVVALSVGALLLRRRRPELALGWFWFLGMLVPVIGLVQVGEQALADRYTYLPLIGIGIALVFPLADLVAARSGRARPALALLVGVLLALGLATRAQARTWHDSSALFDRALAVTEGNYAALVGRANAYADAGEVEAARRLYGQALALRPDYAPALYSLGLLEQEQGRREEAIELYRRAIDSLPDMAAAHLNLGALLASTDTVAAAQEFETVLRLAPEHPEAHLDLGLLLLGAQQLEAGIAHLEAALRVRPDLAVAWEALGRAEEAQGRHAEAVRALQRALADPERVDARRLLAWILATSGEPEVQAPARALQLARSALTVVPDAEALETLAAALAANGDFEAACNTQEAAIALLGAGSRAAAQGRLGLYRARQPFVHAH